ncbi:hypothetical protein QTN47_26225 [Danxiaibacter flavus]|uniref:Uncharacterized protein n=1 Tax=Danxiaibacter flavus TaxID=3049108 RepID=A0ABV3ZMI7_9BACT|nr:hypothetical protein QNM32_26225 [Chitinophagaceae bacterium DXS]
MTSIQLVNSEWSMVKGTNWLSRDKLPWSALTWGGKVLHALI